MENWLFLLSGLLLVAVVLQFITYRRLNRKEQILFYQSQRIEEPDYELEQKKKLLEEAIQEKNQMVAVLSHDLKGPFNRAFALAQLMSLDAENLTDDQKDYLGKIHQITVDGLNMIRNLLDNRKLEEQKFDQILSKVDLSATVTAIARTYSSLAEKKNIMVHLDIQPKITLTSDKLYIIRILDNLLSNAIKFSPPDKNIFLSLKGLNHTVNLIVQDEGPGLSPEDQVNMYQKYQRLTAKPTGGESSTGLGLYIVKNLVERLGGEIHLESEPGQGAKFVVSLKEPVN